MAALRHAPLFACARLPALSLLGPGARAHAPAPPLPRPAPGVAAWARGVAAAADAQFDGEVSVLYGRFFEQLTPVWEHINAGIPKKEGMQVLDIASGPGQPAALVARTRPDARVVSTDLAPDMVEQAIANTSELSNVSCRVLDMQAMDGLSDGEFDVVTCSFGFMFAPDLPSALKETNRVLRADGGTLHATVWQEMPIIPLMGRVMTTVLGAPPPPPPINPMSLAERPAFDGPLADAGFDITSDETGTIVFDLGSDPDFAWRLGTIPVLPTLKELDAAGQHGDVFAKARSAFEAETRSWLDARSGRLLVPAATYRLVVARKASRAR